MLFYIISYGVCFAIEKIQGKIINYFVHKSLKRLTYKNDKLNDFWDWIFI